MNPVPSLMVNATCIRNTLVTDGSPDLSGKVPVVRPDRIITPPSSMTRNTIAIGGTGRSDRYFRHPVIRSPRPRRRTRPFPDTLLLIATGRSTDSTFTEPKKKWNIFTPFITTHTSPPRNVAHAWRRTKRPTTLEGDWSHGHGPQVDPHVFKPFPHLDAGTVDRIATNVVGLRIAGIAAGLTSLRRHWAWLKSAIARRLKIPTNHKVRENIAGRRIASSSFSKGSE